MCWTQSSRKRRSLTAALLACVLIAGLPAAADAKAPTKGKTKPAGTATTQSPTGPIPGSAVETDMPALSVGDPFCNQQQLTNAEASNCRISGSVAQPYPTSRYELDYADPPTGLSQLSPGDWFATLLGQFCAVIWDVWLYAIRGVLALVNWAFALDLVHKTMGAMQQGLAVLHGDIFGVPWLDAALVVAGLWGMWHGIVRRKTTETLAGLAATVAMMVAALVVIANPQGTVGRLSTLANNGSLEALGAVSSANVSQPTKSFANVESGLFTALVLRPWCALEFGDVSYCTQRRGNTTVADMWLAFDAMSPGRQGLYNLATTGNITTYGGVFGTLGKDLGLIQAPPVVTTDQACGSGGDPQQCAALRAAQATSCWNGAVTGCAFSNSQSGEAQMQAGANPLTRVVLLMLIGVGLIGAICLLFYLGLQLVFAAIKTLVLLLALPVILLVAAFGQGGRQTVVSYGQRLLGAIIAKLIYAIFLALVVMIATILNGLQQMSWVSVWILNVVFWWGVFLERKKFVEFISMDKRAREGGMELVGQGAGGRFGQTAMAGFYGFRSLSAAAHGVTRMALAPGQIAQRRSLTRRSADTAALGAADAAALDEGARRSAELARRDSLAPSELTALSAAEGTIDQYQQRQKRLTDLTRERAGLRQRTATDPAARAAAQARLKTLDQDILATSGDIAGRRDDVMLARGTVRQFLPEPSPAALKRTAAQRRRDLQGAFPADDTSDVFQRSLRAAGISASSYGTAAPKQRESYRQQAAAVWRRESRLAAATDPARAGQPDSNRELNSRWRDLAARGDRQAVSDAMARSSAERQRLNRGRGRPRRAA